ncbi:MAG: type III-A CRISPR-associated RAMP protein Csm3 [Syntrophobacteraceae bacterium]
MQLTGIREIKGKIILKSGLRIGAGDVEMRIGGTDNPIIKHPNTQEPFIPGSSIKGKVRSLLELRSGLMGVTKGGTLQPKHLREIDGEKKGECEKILKIFGSSGADAFNAADLGPTRVSFADCPITKNWRDKVRAEHLSLSEVKSENSINRIKGTAENPRFTERVPADTEFDFSVCLKILNPQEDDLFTMLLEGLKLLELDSLGGSGSRGYGKIKFEFIDEKIRADYEKIDPFGKGGQ